MTNIAIWPATSMDAEVLSQLHAPAFPDAWPKEAFAALLERDESFALVGGANNTTPPRGFIVVRVAAGEAEILTFCVDSRSRRHGLGEALLREACRLAIARGATEMFLEVAEDNAAARGLYGKCGFKAVGRRAGYYKQGSTAADALVMRLVLD